MLEPTIQKKLAMAALLPGLYLLRDHILDQIKTIETSLNGNAPAAFAPNLGERKPGRVKGPAKPPSKGWTRTPEQRQKLSESRKAKWAAMPEDERQGILDRMQATRDLNRAAKRGHDA